MDSAGSKGNSLVTYTREGFIGSITLNRPEKRNALSSVVWNSLALAIDEASHDKEARVVLVRGEGKTFCAGLDLSPDNEIVQLIIGKPDASQKMAFYREVKRIQDSYTRLERLSKPTICVIHGYCLGAGLELALCCDIRLCTADSVFALPESKLAIITDVGGLQRLPKVVGPAHAREIAFRGHRFGADRALAIGLVNYVYPDKLTLDEKAMEIALEIASNPPLAVQGAKEVLLYNDEVPMDQALDYTAARSSMIMPSEDLLEAFTAHQEKREGKFKGA